MSIRTGIYVRVSTDDQKENGFSIDSQLRMLKEYCDKNNYDIIGVYDDGGYSGKTLMRPAMQQLLKDIKDHKLDRLVAVKTDRLSRSNLDGFWLLNYCEENDVKIELILEPYDVSTANGEMMFEMNLVFGQRERKEIGARTRRALDEMALERVHPAKAPFGYTRNPDTGHLEINPVEAVSIRRLFDLCKSGKSIRNIAQVLNKEHAYLNCSNGVWKAARVEKILNNKIYIGIFEFGKYKRKQEEILTVEDYCEPIIDMDTWNKTRNIIKKNKHPNYGTFVHTFSSLVKCPLCGEILASSQSYKTRGGKRKTYFHLRCKNSKCSGYNYHYNCEKIEDALIRVLDELTRYMIENKYEIMITNTSYNKDIDKIDKAIIKLEEQEKKLVDLYLESNINVQVINKKNEKLKKDIDGLKKQKEQLDPENLSKEAVVDLAKQFEYKNEENDFLFNNPLAFAFLWRGLNKKSQRDLINELVSSIEIERDKNFNIKITNIKFSEQFIHKTANEYIEYLNMILRDNKRGVFYEGQLDESHLKDFEDSYSILSLLKFQNNIYTEEEKEKYYKLMKDHFYIDGIIERPLIKNNELVDRVIMIPKSFVSIEELKA